MALLDRLCGTPSTDGIAADLLSLLSTRSRLSAGRYCADASSVLDWGLPDLASLDVRAGDDRATVVRAVETAIARFEPRLRTVRVTVEPSTEGPLRARLHVVAALRHAPAAPHLVLELDLPAAAAPAHGDA